MKTFLYLLFGTLLLVLFFGNIYLGPVTLSPSEVTAVLLGNDTDEAVAYIISHNRLPQAITALLAGAALALSGLILQTLFHNPLAGPSVLGITNGASLGVAIVMLATNGMIVTSSGAWGYLLVIAAGLAGALLVTFFLLILSTMVRNSLILLITGIMLSYVISSVITLLTYNASASGIQQYVLWGMGDFSLVSLDMLPWFSTLLILALLFSLPLVKSLNVLQLGTGYAEAMGISVNRARNILLLTTGVLCAVTTAFCGPVSFLGLAVPHIVRFFFRTDNMRMLMPLCILFGAIVALLCNLVCTSLSSTVLPLAAVTPFIGVPVILWVMFTGRR